MPGDGGSPAGENRDGIANAHQTVRFLHAQGRRVLFVAVIAAAVAGVVGAGVSSRLNPFGANDPTTQSVRAQNRVQNATGRQIDPGVIAVVRSGAVDSAAARRRVRAVQSQLAGEPDVAPGQR